MVATASTEHSYWLALDATHATQEIAFEWKPGLSVGAISRSSSHCLPVEQTIICKMTEIAFKFLRI